MNRRGFRFGVGDGGGLEELGDDGGGTEVGGAVWTLLADADGGCNGTLDGGMVVSEAESGGDGGTGIAPGGGGVFGAVLL